MGRFLTIFSVVTKNNPDMKAYHVVITILFFSFLPLTNLFGQNKNESQPISYVANIKKRQSSPVPADDNLSYINPQKRSDIKPSNSIPKKDSFLEDYHRPPVSTPYSYINPVKEQKELVVVVLPTKKTNTIIFGKTKKVSRITIITRPIKKAWNKIFPSKKNSNVPTNFDNDLSFDLADYESIASWAKRCGKTHQAKEVTEKYGEVIKSFSIEFGVDYRVIIAICAHESGGNPNVISEAGASGLMQLMPGTAATYGVYGSDIFDPYMNLRAGTHYFSDMIKMFGNTKDAIYAYGWGHNKAKKRFREGVQSDEVEGVQQVLYLAQIQ